MEEPKALAGPDDFAGLKAAFSGPAPLANRFYLTLTPVTARLAFVEFPPSETTIKEPNFRAGVTLTIADLLAVRDLINTMVKDVQVLPGVEDGNKK